MGRQEGGGRGAGYIGEGRLGCREAREGEVGRGGSLVVGAWSLEGGDGGRAGMG